MSNEHGKRLGGATGSGCIPVVFYGPEAGIMRFLEFFIGDAYGMGLWQSFKAIQSQTIPPIRAQYEW